MCGVKRVAGRLLLLLVSVGVALKIGDLAIGAIDPNGISYYRDQELFRACVDRDVGMRTLRPGSSVEAGVPYRINALGFRDRERSIDKPTGTFRIVAIGDSVTFGWGVPVEQRFTDVMERQLNQQARGGRRIEVINLSVPGYEAVEQGYLFRDVALRLDPDLIVFFFVANDVQLVPEEVAAMRRATSPDQPVLQNVLRRSSVARWMFPNLVNLLRFQMSASTSGDRVEHVHELQGLEKGTAAAAEIYEQAMRRTRAGKASFAVLGLEPFPPIEKACAERDVPFRGVVPADYLSDPTMRNSATDAHPNAKAHERIAGHVIDALNEMALLP